MIAKAPSSERRRASRRQPTQGTTCQLASAGRKLGLGLVWNISTSGVSMLLGQALEPGTKVEGELMAADGHTSLGMSLRVAHMYKLRTGDYFLGGQFQRQLTAQELKPFVGDAA